MPGSMSTGTAASLNNANVSAKKSGDGGTINAVRMPRTMPAAARPSAIASLSAFSSAKVMVRCSLVPVGFTPRTGT